MGPGRLPEVGRPLSGAGFAADRCRGPHPGRQPDPQRSQNPGPGRNEQSPGLDFCQIIGAKSLIGPYHSALNHVCDYSPAPTADEWRWGVDSMRQVAEHAATLGIMLAPEYVNRFECYLVNTAADMVRFVRQVDHPNCRMLYDTFHANIEEKDLREAILGCQAETIHVHISENDRGTPGTGHVDWTTTFDALKETGYDGWMSIEAFGLGRRGTSGGGCSPTRSSWPCAGLAFMKDHCARRGMI